MEYILNKISNKPITQLNQEQIIEINDIIYKLFNYNVPVNQQYTISDFHNIHINFIKSIHPSYQKLFDDIYKYRIQVSKQDIYLSINNLIEIQCLFNTDTIYLLWNYDYGKTKSVINYNFLFLQKLYQLYTNQLYITNFTPDTLQTGDEIDEPVNISNLDLLNYRNLLYTKHQQYFIFDDISYSGTQLMEDCKKWFDYIITNYKHITHISFTLNIFLYGITLNALQSYNTFIHYLTTLEYGHLINTLIHFRLNYTNLLYSSIPFVFKNYIKIKYPQHINDDLNTKSITFIDIPIIQLKRYQNTIDILNQINSNDLILFGDFYFANEINEYKYYNTKRLQTLIYLDYKIPDTRSINDRLFYGFVPIYLLNSEYKSQYKIIGKFNGYDVYQLKLFDDYKPFLNNYIFQTISKDKIKNTSKLIDKNIEKPLIPWYKI